MADSVTRLKVENSNFLCHVNCMNYLAFKFVERRPDLNAPGGVRESFIIAVAERYQEAFDLASDLVAHPQHLTLYKQGDEIMHEAHQMGAKTGQAMRCIP